MTAKRTIRTIAQRRADALKEVAQQEEQAKKQAIDLRTQAEGWEKRAEELKGKATGARAKADNLLEDVEIDPAAFWAEQGEIDWLNSDKSE